MRRCPHPKNVQHHGVADHVQQQFGILYLYILTTMSDADPSANEPSITKVNAIVWVQADVDNSYNRRLPCRLTTINWGKLRHIV